MIEKTPNGIESVKVISVIETRAEIGSGTEKDPVRVATQYWDFEGNLLAIIDSFSCLRVPEPSNS